MIMPLLHVFFTKFGNFVKISQSHYLLGQDLQHIKENLLLYVPLKLTDVKTLIVIFSSV